MRRIVAVTFTCLALATAQMASAAFIIEVDTDGLDDGILAFSPNFSFGGDTTTASQSGASTAVGLTGGDSIFGGNGMNSSDTYVFSYEPGVDGDNEAFAAGTPLNNDGDVASGLAAGGTGLYNVYVTWPITDNISAGSEPTNFRLTDGTSDLFTSSYDPNGGDGANTGVSTGNEWIFVGSAVLDAGTEYQLIQTSSANGFVSMRSSGAMFDLQVPEPSTIVLGCLAFCGGAALIRRRR
jgi:hypothetical protein